MTNANGNGGNTLRDHPECIVDGLGVFVDATNGNDNNVGSRAAPLQTIEAALAKDPLNARRILLCAGTYNKAVTIRRSVRIDGGRKCGSWEYDGNRPLIKPDVEGVAVFVDQVGGGGGNDVVAFADVEIRSLAATAEGGSSIALRLVSSSKVVVRRSKIEAAAAKKGKKGTDVTAVGTHNISPNALPAGIDNPLRVCTCSSGGTTTAGKYGGLSMSGSNGIAGLPAIPGAVAPNDGAGGLGLNMPNTTCIQPEPNGTGNNGAAGINGSTGSAAPKRAVLTASGLAMSTASDGTNGGVGQGGGGGRSFDEDYGGDGGCGGCGGLAGKGGQTGGASIAILSFETPLEITDCTLASGTAGDGGEGGAGAVGGNGGNGAAPFISEFPQRGCAGGNGGKGGNGGWLGRDLGWRCSSGIGSDDRCRIGRHSWSRGERSARRRAWHLGESRERGHALSA